MVMLVGSMLSWGRAGARGGGGGGAGQQAGLGQAVAQQCSVQQPPGAVISCTSQSGRGRAWESGLAMAQTVEPSTSHSDFVVARRAS